MITRDQQRAQTALDHVQALDATLHDDYGRMAHKLPILIRTAGLAQALAFVETRGKDGHKKLLKDLSKNVLNNDGLLEESRSADLVKYMQLTNEVLACCLWYKRCAQSVLNIEAGDSDD